MRAAEWKQAVDVCRRGLKHFPYDLDILGNQTQSLYVCGDLDATQESALLRLSLRRDVQSLEEVTLVMSAQRKACRDTDLPKAIQFARMEFQLIREGLTMNPHFRLFKKICG